MFEIIFYIIFLCVILYILFKPSHSTAIDKIPYFLVLYSIYNIWQGYIIEIALVIFTRNHK